MHPIVSSPVFFRFRSKAMDKAQSMHRNGHKCTKEDDSMGGPRSTMRITPLDHLDVGGIGHFSVPLAKID